MQSSKSTALIRLSSDSELMPPPPKRIKRPKNVLDEESYTDAISEIIARDFFPGLLETETQQEYLDALDSKDNAWIESAGRRLQHVMTPGRRNGRRGTSLRTPLRASDTPRSFVGDTPMSAASDTTSVTGTRAATEIDTNMSLDRFQSLYTSEDNESFYKLLDKQNQKRAEKYAWMWSGNNKLPSKMMLKQKEIETKLLMSRESLEDDGGKKDRLAIRYIAEKPARPDAWKSKPNNSLMFAPDSVEDSIETTAQRAQNESKAELRGVSYANTRMPVLAILSDSPSIPPSPSLSAVKDAIAGKRRAFDLESDSHGSETPRVNGYAFIDDEPDAEAIGSAPIISLGRGESTKNPFVIKEQSKREDLHHRLVDKHAKIKRASTANGFTGKVDSTPVPRFPSSPQISSGQFTPAAQRLWNKVGGPSNRPATSTENRTLHTPKNRSGLRARWTPESK
jgi:protein DGCR14